MVLSRLWGCWTVMVLLPVTLSLGCKLYILHEHEQHIRRTLDKVDSRLTFRCKTRNKELWIKTVNMITLSESLNDEEKMQVIHQTLDQIMKIFNASSRIAPWGDDLQHHLMVWLKQQLVELRGCISESVADHQNQKIQEYFKNLRNILEMEKSNDCFWKIFHTHTKNYLRQIRTLMAKIQRNTQGEKKNHSKQHVFN